MFTLLNLVYLSAQSYIVENAVYLARGLFGSPSGNTTSLYPDTIFSVFNFSADPLVTYFVSFFIYISGCL